MSHKRLLHSQQAQQRDSCPRSRPLQRMAYHSDPGQQSELEAKPSSRFDRNFSQIPVQSASPSLQKNRTGLPDALKAGTEMLSDVSLDDVKVHYNSIKPIQLQAHAYTQGTNIYVAPGQEKHLPHEAWHIVQQKQGRVRPNSQIQGKAANVESHLEQEADRMGQKATDLSAFHLVAQTQIQDKTVLKNSAAPVVQRITLSELEGLSNEERAIYEDWIEWAAVRDGNKGKEKVLAEYTLGDLKGALSEYRGNPWRRYLAEFAAMAREKRYPLEMSDIILLDEAVQRHDPALSLDFARLAGIKNLDRKTIIHMLEVYKGTVEPRGYPFPFESENQYKDFKSIIKGFVDNLKITYKSIRIQGSSLRKEKPNDIDIGIMVDEKEFDRLYDYLIATTPDSGTKMKKKLRSMKQERKHINSYILSFIQNPPLKVFETAKTALNKAMGRDMQMEVQLSVVLIGSGMDLKPFLDF